MVDVLSLGGRRPETLILREPVNLSVRLRGHQPGLRLLIEHGLHVRRLIQHRGQILEQPLELGEVGIRNDIRSDEQVRNIAAGQHRSFFLPPVGRDLLPFDLYPRGFFHLLQPFHFLQRLGERMLRHNRRQLDLLSRRLSGRLRSLVACSSRAAPGQQHGRDDDERRENGYLFSHFSTSTR
ncbi:hypothetical protein D1872_241240 [compost metagenome]